MKDVHVIAGQISISQQLLDRSEPNVFDIISSVLDGTYVAPVRNPDDYIEWTDGSDEHWNDDDYWDDY